MLILVKLGILQSPPCKSETNRTRKRRCDTNVRSATVKTRHVACGAAAISRRFPCEMHVRHLTFAYTQEE